MFARERAEDVQSGRAHAYDDTTGFTESVTLLELRHEPKHLPCT
jgi:hypothetical protein